MLGKLVGSVIALGIAGAAGLGVWRHAQDVRQADEVWQALVDGAEPNAPAYDPAMVADQPEIARRYFAAAIQPGTPLYHSVHLVMEGDFRMNGKALPMQAVQVLAPPDRGFVWKARIGSGVLTFAGSDGCLEGGTGAQSWTKFWLAGLIPLARDGGNPDHLKSARTRLMMESVWVPAALLPQNGAVWRQIGPDRAEVRFTPDQGLAPMELTLDAEGRITELTALRWSNANRDKTYRLQPFGGRIVKMGRVGGFLIPTEVELGNLWGTPDFDGFFTARITSATYGPVP